MVPFILLMMGLVWDLRAYIAYHTKVTREIYVVAEVIANETGPTSGENPIGAVVSEVVTRLERDGAGRVSVSLVARGDRRSAIDPNPHPDCSIAAQWCLPRVTATWPPATAPNAGTWNAGGDCANYVPALPSPGEHFQADQTVLPNEVPTDVAPPPPHENWVSRNLRPEEWWVVVDTCLHPHSGLFGGLVLRGIEFFDVSSSALVLRKRAAWGSIHDYSDCNWCP